MRVTIMADASWCPETGIGGYGYWIASDRGKAGGGGVMQTRRIASSTVAELMAIANAVYHAIDMELVQENDRVLIQSDSTGALRALEGKDVVGGKSREVCGYMSRMRQMFNLQFDYRHVKGHSREKEARYYANNHCDKRAKDAMRKARDAFLNHQGELFR